MRNYSISIVFTILVFSSCVIFLSSCASESNNKSSSYSADSLKSLLTGNVWHNIVKKEGIKVSSSKIYKDTLLYQHKSEGGKEALIRDEKSYHITFLEGFKYLKWNKNGEDVVVEVRPISRDTIKIGEEKGYYVRKKMGSVFREEIIDVYNIREKVIPE